MAKTIEEKFKKLSDIEHVLLRPGRYLGSIKSHSALTWIYDENLGQMIKKEIAWNPALLKMFDEVITNSVDESKEKDSRLNTIKINISKEDGKIRIWDNGGIPVVIHKVEKQYLPEMLFSELKAGSNFDDEEISFGSGQNGEGTTLVNIFCTEYKVDTSDGKKRFVQKYKNNMHVRTKPKITKCTDHYTDITFTPDYEKLKTSMTDNNYMKLVKRIYDIAACNPKLNISLNGKKIKIKSFKDYIKMYTNDDCIFEENKNWRIGISGSSNGFEHISFINGEQTLVGGTHISYISDQITNKLREYFKKKHKVEVKPYTIRSHMILFIDGDIVNPRYSGQTKDELQTEVRDYKTTFKVSDKFISKILNSPIILDVLDWIEAKRIADEKAELRKLNKNNTKANPRKIVKFSDANEKKDRSKCFLFITEGDAAAKPINAVADRRYIGNYPLKGKPLNVSEMKTAKLIENEEFSNLMTIIGLQLGVPVMDPNALYFGKIVIFSDQDLDGFHICGLMINMLHTFWPELFELNLIYKMKTPIVIVKTGKKEIDFFTEEDFKEWKEKNKDKKYKSKYYKGLGTFKNENFKKYMNNLDKYIVPLTIEDKDDIECIDLAFNRKRADARKEWLNIEEK